MRLSNNYTLALAALAASLLLAIAASARQKGDETSKTPASSAQTAADSYAIPVPQTAPAAAAATGAHQHEHGTASKSPDGAGQRVVGKTMTIVGEVMDPACFLEAGVKSIGPGHYQCAIDCARSGQTLAIYDRNQDRIYFIAGELPGKNPNDPLMPYIHKKVDVTGTVYHRADAYGIVILKVALHVDKAGGTAAGAPAGK